MTIDTDKFLEDYAAWVKSKISFKALKSGWIELSTPCLDRHNDYIQIYIKQDHSGYVLSDDGHTIDDLEMSGFTFSTEKRRKLLAEILNGFGIQQEDNRLITKADQQTLPAKKHDLVQAIISVNNLFCLAPAYVEGFFFEDVSNWLDSHEVRYTSKVKLIGKTGFDYVIDFIIPKSKVAPERLLQLVPNPSKKSTQHTVLVLSDIKEGRPLDCIRFALLNDADKKVPSQVISALHQYEILPFVWSEREKLKPELVV